MSFWARGIETGNKQKQNDNDDNENVDSTQ